MVVFYLVCLTVGFLFSLMGAVFGGAFGHGGFGGHAGLGHGVEIDHGGHFGHGHIAVDHESAAGSNPSSQMPGASVFNAMTVSTFIAFFGGGGLIAMKVLGLGPLWSVAAALPVALIIAACQFLLLVHVFIHAQASSEALRAVLVGCEAGVITSIAADRTGRISYVLKGSRFTAPAISLDGESIDRGAKVRIAEVRGATTVVEPM
jgi:membrane protein implicated in regulation of membrane protease activity